MPFFKSLLEMLRSSKKILKIIISTSLFILVCCIQNKNPFTSEGDVEHNHYWSEPTIDSYYLAFQISDSIYIYSVFAGEIQFRLDLARNVDSTLYSIHPMPSFELGVLLLGISDELYNNFNPETLRFNSNPIDSLLNIYSPLEGRLLSGGSPYAAILKFDIYYNMPIMAQYFKDIPGIWYSNAAWYGTIPEGPPYLIYLEITENIYEFTFIFRDWNNNYKHYWIVEVENDQATLISEWEDTIY